MSRWTRATVAPRTRVSRAMTHTTGCQSTRRVPKDVTKTRNSAAKPPALAMAAMNPVTGLGRHFEQETHQHEGHPGQQQPVVQEDVAGQVVGDLGQVARARGPVDEGDAVQEDGRRERTQDEVLEGGLPRLAAP